MLKQLVKVANRLDLLGLTKEADVLDLEIVRLASDGDFSLGDFDSEEEEDQNEITERYSPTSFPEPEVVRIKTSPSSFSPYESAASASDSRGLLYCLGKGRVGGGGYPSG
jgi:hypothetical protein